MYINDKPQKMKVNVFLLACFILLISCKQTPKPLKNNQELEQKILKVACIGDQIMLGEQIDSIDRYPAQLQWLLGDKYQVKTYALNNATVLINGTQPFLSDTLYKQAIDFQPDIVVINLGINDTKTKDWLTYGQEFLEDYMNLVETFMTLHSRPKVFICRPTKPFSNVDEINDSTLQAGVLPDIDSVSAWRHLRQIDLYNITSYRSDMFINYVYPDRTGCRILAETIADAIISDKN